MAFDVGTLSGVLGVILTILFFVIGYRQTVGAKKERGSAANKEILDVLLRRFVLEHDFQIDYDELNKFLYGKGIEHKVGITEIFSPREFECVLLARIIESDYVDPEGRKIIISRIKSTFKLNEKTEMSINRRKIPENYISTTKMIWILSAASGLMAALISIFVTILKTKYSGAGIDVEKIVAISLSMLLVVVVTVFMIVIYSSIRERMISTANGMENRIKQNIAHNLELRVINLLRRDGYEFIVGQIVDYVVISGEKRIGIEVHGGLNIRNINRNKLERLYYSDNLNELIIVLNENVKVEAKNLPNWTNVVNINNFLEILKDTVVRSNN